jgi:hypothetical protein
MRRPHVEKGVRPPRGLGIEAERTAPFRFIAGGALHLTGSAQKSIACPYQRSTSALIRRGHQHAAVLLDGLAEWMARNRYASVSEVRGLLAVPADTDQAAYERAGYVRALRDANGAPGDVRILPTGETRVRSEEELKDLFSNGPGMTPIRRSTPVVRCPESQGDDRSQAAALR